MNPDTERFIALSTRPLGDNAELRLAAEGELRKSIEAADRPEALAEAVESLERADRQPRRWRLVLLGVMLVVSLPLLGHTLWQATQLAGFRALFSFSDEEIPWERSVPDLTPAQRLLLFGASGATNQADKWKPLWDSEPENPAYLAEYAAAYFSDHKSLSPEILAAAERIDPENSWFPALAAAGLAEGAVTKERVPSTGSKVRTAKAPVWKIDDAKRLGETLAGIHRLSGKSRHTAYYNERLRQRLPLFPPRRDYVSRLPRVVYAASQNSKSFALRRLADVLAAGAQQCAAKGDVEGFRQIVVDWRFLTEASIRGGETLIDGMIARVTVAGPLKNFRDAAKTLGLEGEAAEFAELDDRVYREHDTRQMYAKSNGTGEIVELHGSMFATLTLPWLSREVISAPVVTEAELRPGRYAEHAVFERLGTWPAWGLLGMCAVVAALSRYRQNPLAWRLSGRMQELFRGSDWARVILGGLVFPVIWYLGITRLSPLAAREWSAWATDFIQPGGQFGCMVLTMIILPVMIASRRLARRGVAFGLAGRYQWLGWLAAGAALAGVPAFGGMLFPAPTGRAFQISAYGLAGLAVTWIFAGLAVNGIGQASQSLRRATLARLLPTAWLAGMLVLAGLVPFFYAEERRWIQQDVLYAVSPDFPAPTRYEYEVSRILRSELLDLIGKPEKPAR